MSQQLFRSECCPFCCPYELLSLCRPVHGVIRSTAAANKTGFYGLAVFKNFFDRLAMKISVAEPRLGNSAKSILASRKTAK